MRGRPPFLFCATHAFAAAFFAACWRSAPDPAPLTVDHTSPALGDRAQPLLLNDAITVYFTDRIQPLSVTSASVSLLDEAGHQVPGTLRVGANYVSFQPNPPLSADLGDGSYRPGARYQLLIAGCPRPDAVRAADGRWLDAVASYDVHVAELTDRPAGLPSVLRPPASDLPFLLRAPDVPLQLAADAPRLQLHFSLPVLPSSLTADAFEIQLLKGRLEELRPRSVRAITSPFDELPGSSVEIDLGALPQRVDGTPPLALREGDLISVAVRAQSGLCDYAGNAPLPSPPSCWPVVAGRSVPLCEWPADEDAYTGLDELLPGFEVRGAVVRPQVRVEAGDGSLGIFRPRQDTVLRPGQPFDRGDGREVVSAGPDFAFTAIDVPAGVEVTIDADSGPVRLRACGGVRIAGALLLRAAPARLPAGRFQTQVEELVDAAPVTVLAAGDIDLPGRIDTATAVPADHTVLLLATAGRLRLSGNVPFQTMLAVEARNGGSVPTIEGSRGQSRTYATTFTYGVSPAAAITVRGVLPWRQLPLHRDGGHVQVIEATGDVQLAWQSAPPDALRGDRPDVSAGRIASWQPVRPGDGIATAAGAFVRFELLGRVRSGQEVPRLRALRIVED